MVWEQGSVVIVMLTKLTENGVAMCHRYWPEEGSDLYHIYEVSVAALLSHSHYTSYNILKEIHLYSVQYNCLFPPTICQGNY